MSVKLQNDCRCTGNNWGRDVNGTLCLGCGAQEEFYGCADIAIVNSTQRPRLSVERIHNSQIPVTRPHSTISSPSQTTAVVHPVHVQRALPAETTATPAGPAVKLTNSSKVVVPEKTTSSSAALLRTKVIQFAGQPYDVVVHSSVFLLFSLMFHLIATGPTGL